MDADPVVAGLSDPDPRRRQEALYQALSERRADLVPVIQRCAVNEPSADLAVLAAQVVLSLISSPPDEARERQLRARLVEIRSLAGLSSLDWEFIARQGRKSLLAHVFKVMGSSPPSLATTFLEATLQHHDPDVRGWATVPASHFPHETIFAHLLSRISDPDRRVAQAAFTAIQAMSSSDRAGQVDRALRSNDQWVVTTAATFLPMLADAALAPGLQRWQNHPQPMIAERAREALRRLEQRSQRSEAVRMAAHSLSRSLAAAKDERGKGKSPVVPPWEINPEPLPARKGSGVSSQPFTDAPPPPVERRPSPLQAVPARSPSGGTPGMSPAERPPEVPTSVPPVSPGLTGSAGSAGPAGSAGSTVSAGPEKKLKISFREKLAQRAEGAGSSAPSPTGSQEPFGALFPLPGEKPAPAGISDTHEAGRKPPAPGWHSPGGPDARDAGSAVLQPGVAPRAGENEGTVRNGGFGQREGAITGGGEDGPKPEPFAELGSQPLPEPPSAPLPAPQPGPRQGSRPEHHQEPHQELLQELIPETHPESGPEPRPAPASLPEFQIPPAPPLPVPLAASAPIPEIPSAPFPTPTVTPKPAPSQPPAISSPELPLAASLPSAPPRSPSASQPAPPPPPVAPPPSPPAPNAPPMPVEAMDLASVAGSLGASSLGAFTLEPSLSGGDNGFDTSPPSGTLSFPKTSVIESILKRYPSFLTRPLGNLYSPEKPDEHHRNIRELLEGLLGFLNFAFLQAYLFYAPRNPRGDQAVKDALKVHLLGPNALRHLHHFALSIKDVKGSDRIFPFPMARTLTEPGDANPLVILREMYQAILHPTPEVVESLEGIVEQLGPMLIGFKGMIGNRLIIRMPPGTREPFLDLTGPEAVPLAKAQQPELDLPPGEPIILSSDRSEALGLFPYFTFDGQGLRFGQPDTATFATLLERLSLSDLNG